MIKYRGGKSKEIPFITQYLPHFDGRYIEPFLGGGALYFFLEPQQAIINDLNTRLYDFYIGIRDNFDIVKAELEELQRTYQANRAAFDALKLQNPNIRVADANEKLYYHMRDMYNHLVDEQYSPATIYYFINKTAFSGMIRYNARGEFNVPFGRYSNFNTTFITPSHRDLLRRSVILNADYKVAFNMAVSDDFIFLDPPYDCIFSDYGNVEYREDGFGEESHRRLHQDFLNLPCPSMIVIGLTPLTKELYGNMIRGQYGKNYSVNIRNRFHSAAQHIVVTNYEI